MSVFYLLFIYLILLSCKCSVDVLTMLNTLYGFISFLKVCLELQAWSHILNLILIFQIFKKRLAKDNTNVEFQYNIQ